MSAMLQALEAEARRASDATTLEFDGTFVGIRYLRTSLVLLDERPAIPPEWLMTGGHDRAAGRANALESAIALQRERESSLSWRASRWSTLSPESAVEFGAAETAVTQTPLRVSDESMAAGVRELQEFLSASTERLRRMNDDARTVAWAFGLSTDGIDVKRAEQLAMLGCLAEAPHRPEPHWLQPAIADALTPAASELQTLIAELVAHRERLSTIFTDQILDEDLDGLVRRFAEEHRGIRRLSSKYREDRYRVAVRTHRKKRSSGSGSASESRVLSGYTQTRSVRTTIAARRQTSPFSPLHSRLRPMPSESSAPDTKTR